MATPRPATPIHERALRRAPMIAVVAAAALVAGCGSGSSASTTLTKTVTSTATSAAVPSSGAASATTATSVAPTTTSAQAQAASVACRSVNTVVSIGAGTAGLGHVGEALRFRNAGTTTCVLSGYPGVALIRASGARVQAKRTPNGYLGGLAAGAQTPPVLELRPGETVSALLEGINNQGGGDAPCPSYVALLVTPPNLRLSRRLGRPFAVCAAEVHPVVPGLSGGQG